MNPEVVMFAIFCFSMTVAVIVIFSHPIVALKFIRAVRDIVLAWARKRSSLD